MGTSHGSALPLSPSQAVAPPPPIHFSPSLLSKWKSVNWTEGVRTLPMPGKRDPTDLTKSLPKRIRLSCSHPGTAQLAGLRVVDYMVALLTQDAAGCVRDEGVDGSGQRRWRSPRAGLLGQDSCTTPQWGGRCLGP